MGNGLSPEDLASDLRDGSGKFLKRRRGIVGLSLFSAGVMGGIALYQMGIMKEIPEPHCSGLNAEKVNGSREAYSHLSTPDALLGCVSYGITACLAGAGGQRRSETQPLVPLGMAGKLVLDAMLAGKLTVDELTKFRACSFWSLLATAATFAALPLAASEAGAALNRLREAT